MKIQGGDRDYLVERLSVIERQMEVYLAEVREAKRDFAEHGRPDTLTNLLNSLLWMLPNLGIQTVISTVVRDLEREKSK